MIALTSLAPGHDRAERQRFCIESWRRAGLTPVSLNHQKEVTSLRASYPDVEFNHTTATGEHLYGKPFVEVNALLTWVEMEGETALLVNADLEIDMEPEVLRRLAYTARDGLGYLLQWNYSESKEKAVAEPCGLSAFLVRPDHARLCAPSPLMCFGQPWWDYWLPYMVLKAGQRLYTTKRPTGWHQAHPGQWLSQSWDRCAVEFARLAGLDAGNDRAARSRLSAGAHAEIRQHTTYL